MSIQFYIGAEGSGKTYQVVTVVVREALKQGRRVFTNIPQINAELIIQHIKDNDFEDPALAENHQFGSVEYFRSHEIHDNPKFYPDLSDRNFVNMSDLGDLSQYRVQAGDLFVIDECFEVYHRERKLPLHDETFFRKHRKYVNEKTLLSTEIIVMTQDKDACNKHLLSTVTFTYWASKKEEIGQPDRYNVDVYNGLVKSRDKPFKQFLLLKYDPDKFSWYKSHAIEGAKQQSVDSRQNVITKWKKIQLIAFPVLFIGLLIWAYYHYTGKAEKAKSDKAEKQAKQEESKKSTNNTIDQVTKNYDTKEAETEWYIAGRILKGGNQIFYLSNGQVTKTILNPNFYAFGRTYNIEVNGKWYTNYAYVLQSSAPASPVH